MAWEIRLGTLDTSRVIEKHVYIYIRLYDIMFQNLMGTDSIYRDSSTLECNVVDHSYFSPACH